MRRVKNDGDRWLRDERGGALILRGTNVSGRAKWSDDRLPPLGWADFVRLRDELGMNAIRLLVFWEAVEPGPGAYDRKYLASVRELAGQASDAGLHVMVDMHQDLWGRGFGSAGAPRWTCNPREYDGFRRSRGPGWFAGYFSPQVTRCFDAFWADEELQEAFAATWVEVARALSDIPGVLALDLFNEPFWGSSAVTPFESRILPDLYFRLIEALRSAGWDRWLALEPASIANVGYTSKLRPPSRERVLLAPHFYPAQVETGVGYAGEARPLADQLSRLEALAERCELPLVIGEIGARRNVPGAAAYLEHFYDLADERMVGCFQWDADRATEEGYGLFDPHGAHTLASRAVARPAPCRVAGTPLGWSWDPKRRRFELRWREERDADGPTLVSAPRLAFPKGFSVSVDGGGEVEALDHGVRVAPADGGERRLILTER